jgi:hypothetical protein
MMATRVRALQGSQLAFGFAERVKTRVKILIASPLCLNVAGSTSLNLTAQLEDHPDYIFERSVLKYCVARRGTEWDGQLLGLKNIQYKNLII